MAIPNLRSLAADIRSVLDELISPEYQGQLRSAVKESLAGYTLAGMQLQRARPPGSTEEVLKELSLTSATRLVSRIRQILRRGGIPEYLRYAGQCRLPSVRTQRYSSIVNNFPRLRDELFNVMLDRHHPAWRDAESISIEEVPQAAYELMIKDLEIRKIDPDFIDVACAGFLSDAHYACEQLVCVSFRVGIDMDAFSLGSLLCKWQDLLENPRASVADLDEATQFVTSVKSALESRDNPDVEQQDDDARQASADLPRISGVLHGVLVTPPVSWTRFRSQIQEHFPRALIPHDDEEPEKWKWLCEASLYLIVFYTNAGLGEASPYTQHRLRRLTALARCFRQNDDADRYAVAGSGPLWWGLDADSAADCRLMAIATSEPTAFKNPKLFLIDTPDPKWRSQLETDEFSVAGRPFVTIDGFKALENAGLMECWRWIETVQSDSARKAKNALECYETALSLGGGRGTIAPDMEEGWSLIALMTSLEVIFCDGYQSDNATRVLDGVYLSLKKPNSDAKALQCRDVVLKSQKARNDLVHGGKLSFDSNKLAELPSIVASVIYNQIIKNEKRR